MSKAKFNPILAAFEKSLRLLNITPDELEEEIYRLKLPLLDPQIQFQIEHDGFEITDILSNPDITFSEPHGYILFRNRPVLAYIRDQIIGRKDYETGNFNKFHVCFCGALTNAERQNRLKSRYIVTTNTRGNFLVNIYLRYANSPIEKNVYKRLRVCQFCLRTLNWKNFNAYCGAGNGRWSHEYTDERHRIVETFNIDELLQTARRDLLSGAENFASTLPLKEYSLPSKVKAELKRRCNYKCQRCGKITVENQLQIHHRDHNQGNNSADNLMVVCIDCHDAIHRAEGGFLQKIKPK